MRDSLLGFVSIYDMTVGVAARDDFRVGSKGDLTAPKSNFRSAPESGLKSDIVGGPVRANNRLIQPSINKHRPCGAKGSCRHAAHSAAKPGMTVSANRRMFSREPWPNSST